MMGNGNMDEGGSPPGSPMSSRLAGVDRATATALKKAEAAAKVSQMAASQMSASQLAVAAALPRAAGTAVPQPTASRSNTVEVEEMEVDVEAVHVIVNAMVEIKVTASTFMSPDHLSEWARNKPGCIRAWLEQTTGDGGFSWVRHAGQDAAFVLVPAERATEALTHSGLQGIVVAPKERDESRVAVWLQAQARTAKEGTDLLAGARKLAKEFEGRIIASPKGLGLSVPKSKAAAVCLKSGARTESDRPPLFHFELAWGYDVDGLVAQLRGEVVVVRTLGGVRGVWFRAQRNHVPFKLQYGSGGEAITVTPVDRIPHCKQPTTHHQTTKAAKPAQPGPQGVSQGVPGSALATEAERKAEKRRRKNEKKKAKKALQMSSGAPWLHVMQQNSRQQQQPQAPRQPQQPSQQRMAPVVPQVPQSQPSKQQQELKELLGTQQRELRQAVKAQQQERQQQAEAAKELRRLLEEQRRETSQLAKLLKEHIAAAVTPTVDADAERRVQAAEQRAKKAQEEAATANAEARAAKEEARAHAQAAADSRAVAECAKQQAVAVADRADVLVQQADARAETAGREQTRLEAEAAKAKQDARAVSEIAKLDDEEKTYAVSEALESVETANREKEAAVAAQRAAEEEARTQERAAAAAQAETLQAQMRAVKAEAAYAQHAEEKARVEEAARVATEAAQMAAKQAQAAKAQAVVNAEATTVQAKALVAQAEEARAALATRAAAQIKAAMEAQTAAQQEALAKGKEVVEAQAAVVKAMEQVGKAREEAERKVRSKLAEEAQEAVKRVRAEAAAKELAKGVAELEACRERGSLDVLGEEARGWLAIVTAKETADVQQTKAAIARQQKKKSAAEEQEREERLQGSPVRGVSLRKTKEKRAEEGQDLRRRQTDGAIKAKRCAQPQGSADPAAMQE